MKTGRPSAGGGWSVLELLLALAVVGTVGSLFAMSLTRDVGLEDSAPRVAQSLRRARADWELRVGRGELPPPPPPPPPK